MYHGYRVRNVLVVLNHKTFMFSFCNVRLLNRKTYESASSIEVSEDIYTVKLDGLDIRASSSGVVLPSPSTLTQEKVLHYLLNVGQISITHLVAASVGVIVQLLDTLASGADRREFSDYERFVQPIGIPCIL